MNVSITGSNKPNRVKKRDRSNCLLVFCVGPLATNPANDQQITSPTTASTIIIDIHRNHHHHCSHLSILLINCKCLMTRHVLIGSLNRVLHTTARPKGRILRFDQVTEYMRDVLHWLPYLHCMVYRISALVRRCIEGLAPPYLHDLCCSTTQVPPLLSLLSSAS